MSAGQEDAGTLTGSQSESAYIFESETQNVERFAALRAVKQRDPLLTSVTDKDEFLAEYAALREHLDEPVREHLGSVKCS